jgi:hypothetical protein
MDEGAKVPGNDAALEPEDTTTSGKRTGCCRGWRRRRLILLALALLAATSAVTAWLIRDTKPEGPPQFIESVNGEKYQFAGTTFSTKNVPPSFEAKLVNALPAPLANGARSYVGRQISQDIGVPEFNEPRLFVWFQRVETNERAGSRGWPIIIAVLTDKEGVEAGDTDYPNFGDSIAWYCASFPVFPRRSRLLQISLYPNTGRFPVTPFASISIPNPLYGNYPEWKAEPLPAVKKAGDLEVRLDDLIAGATGGHISGAKIITTAHDSWDLAYQSATKGRRTVTAFDVSFRSPRGTNEVWAVQSAELSDATGNVLRSQSFRYSSPTFFSGFFRPPESGWTGYRESVVGTLWPDEAAWRLKLEVKRASGFAPDEIVTFKNVPVPAVGTTNKTHITKTAGGIQVVLTKFQRWTNLDTNRLPDSEATIELPGKPKGVAVDFAGMKTDAGHAELFDSDLSGSACVVSFTLVPASAKTVDLTWVVQKTRSVEFLVKPPKPE